MKTDEIRLMQIARGHIEMVLMWSIEAAFSSKAPEEVKWPLAGVDATRARGAYKSQVFRVLSRMHAPKKKK